MIFRIILFVIMIMQVGCLIAGGPASMAKHPKPIEVSIAAGPNWMKTERSTDIVISPFETDSARRSQTNSNESWMLGMGYRFYDDQGVSRLLCALNLYQMKGTIEGNVWQFSLPEFYNGRFNVAFKSTRLMFDFKLNLFTWQRISPYFIAGVGAAWNSMNYNESPNEPDALADDHLRLNQHALLQPAGEFGAGFALLLTEHLSANLDYVYGFLGQALSAKQATNGLLLIEAPHFSFQTQSLLFGLSFRL
jgi:hypothetical protein